jgi:hypothetical protein
VGECMRRGVFLRVGAVNTEPARLLAEHPVPTVDTDHVAPEVHGRAGGRDL